MNKTEFEKIMSTTEIGETVVLIETEKNTYVRRKKSLQRIKSEGIEIKKI